MKQVNIGYYIQKVNEIVEVTEQTGEEMNPYYEIVRGAIDNGTHSEITADKIKEIKDVFSTGVAKYEGLLNVIKSLKSPIRVVAMHKKLEASFTNFVAGCEEMIASLGDKGSEIDVEKFNSSEKKQDESTETIIVSIQKMSDILLK